jgi:predicted RNase H-like nuclease (RuvC/YqgF family)
MKRNIENLKYDVEAALNLVKQKSFDEAKWQWNDTKRINEQEKRITHCEETLANLKKEVDTLIQSMLSLGSTRFDLAEYAKKSLSPRLHQAEYWVKEEYHQN